MDRSFCSVFTILSYLFGYKKENLPLDGICGAPQIV